MLKVQTAHPKNIAIQDYTYPLPEERIANHPLPERDNSKLLIWNKSASIQTDIYRNIANHIPAQSMLVFNQTKVVAARLLFKKDTGATIELFCLEPDARYPDIQTAMQIHDEVYWNCLVGGVKKLKDQTALTLKDALGNWELQANIVELNDNQAVVLFKWKNFENAAKISFAEILQKAGNIPLPPYIKRQVETDDTNRYQTIFAKEEGSVAAPTAGLHFTDYIFQQLAQKNIHPEFVTLHVGAGTFMPVKSNTMETHAMHAEWMEISTTFIEKLIEHCCIKKLPLFVTGTTAARTVESIYWLGHQASQNINILSAAYGVSQWYPYEYNVEVSVKRSLETLLNYMKEKDISNLRIKTQIIIAPGYRFKLINGLITNFHQPNSTLLLLVAAITGPAWKEIYDYALTNDFRFLSYGDGCLLNIANETAE